MAHNFVLIARKLHFEARNPCPNTEFIAILRKIELIILCRLRICKVCICHYSIDSFSSNSINYQSRQNTKSVMHLLRSALRQPRNGNPNPSYKYAPHLSVSAFVFIRWVGCSVQIHLTTYYLVAFLFPRSFRGFWLNAK